MFALGTRLTPLRIPTSRARVHRGRGLAARPARVRARHPAQPGPASLEGQTPVGDEPFSLGLRRDAETRSSSASLSVAARWASSASPRANATGVVSRSRRYRSPAREPRGADPRRRRHVRVGTKGSRRSQPAPRSARPSTSSRSTTGSRTRLGCTFSSISATAATSSPAPARRIRRTIRRPTRPRPRRAETSEEEDAERAGECWKPFSEATAAPMIRGMLRALAACHEHGVVHRDVKPANFLFMREPDGSRRVKLSDFGLAARIRAAGKNSPNSAARTPTSAPRWRAADLRFQSGRVGRGRGGVHAPRGRAALRGLGRHPRTSRADQARITPQRSSRQTGNPRGSSPALPGRAIAPVQSSHRRPGQTHELRRGGGALLGPREGRRIARGRVGEHRRRRLQAYGTLGAVRRASIRAAFEATSSASFSASVDGDVTAATARLVRVVEKAAEEACANHDECDVGDDVHFETGVRVDALMLALRDHGAELAPEEWSSLIRPVAGRAAGEPDGGGGAFVNNAPRSPPFSPRPPAAPSRDVSTRTNATWTTVSMPNRTTTRTSSVRYREMRRLGFAPPPRTPPSTGTPSRRRRFAGCSRRPNRDRARTRSPRPTRGHSLFRGRRRRGVRVGRVRGTVSSDAQGGV